MTLPKVRNDNTDDHYQGTFKHFNATFSFPSLGMEEVGLQTALAKWPCLVDVIFACEKDRTLTGDEFTGKITFEERDASNNTKAAEFFIRYIEFMELRKEGISRLMLQG